MPLEMLFDGGGVLPHVRQTLFARRGDDGAPGSLCTADLNPGRIAWRFPCGATTTCGASNDFRATGDELARCPGILLPTVALEPWCRFRFDGWRSVRRQGDPSLPARPIVPVAEHQKPLTRRGCSPALYPGENWLPDTNLTSP